VEQVKGFKYFMRLSLEFFCLDNEFICVHMR
jgi:hypothetical protein